MGEFLRIEKARHATPKHNSPYFSEAAGGEGAYGAHTYTFCLPCEYAEENLFSGIRQSCVEYFANKKIKWHHGRDVTQAITSAALRSAASTSCSRSQISPPH
jgi:hypothetical protein